jgi:hypothetical protein
MVMKSQVTEVMSRWDISPAVLMLVTHAPAESDPGWPVTWVGAALIVDCFLLLPLSYGGVCAVNAPLMLIPVSACST